MNAKRDSLIILSANNNRKKRIWDLLGELELQKMNIFLLELQKMNIFFVLLQYTITIR